MAEEKQEDLSMEDILSSIKDILDKDAEGQAGNAASATAPVPPQTPAPVSASEPAAVVSQTETAEPEPEEDVYDLSKAMIIDDGDPLLSSLNDSSSENEDIDLKLDDVDANLEDLNLDDLPEVPVAADESKNNVQPVAVDSVPAVSKPEAPASAIVLPADEEAKVEAVPVEDEADPLDHLSDSPVFEIEELDSLPAEAPVIEQENDKDEVSANIDAILSSASEAIDADTKPEAPIAAAEAVEEKTPEENGLPKTEETVQNSAEDDAADVSANIISNFAKMFAEKKEDIVAAETAAPAVADFSAVKFLGEGSKTIEQVVENVIREIISSTVSAELAANVDIIAFAKEEIEAQTKEWLDANLPAVVENTVQKEIERVMAKVGK